MGKTPLRIATLVVVVFSTQSALGELTYTRIVDTATPVPGGPGTFTHFDTPLFGNGNVAFSGRSGAFEGLYRYRTSVGDLSVIADENTLIPGETTPFSGFVDLSYDGRRTAFNVVNEFGQLRGTYSTTGGLHAVADENTPVPGGTGNFKETYVPTIVDGQTAFVADDQVNARGVYADYGGLHLVADQNTPVPGGTGNFTGFSFSDLAFDGQSTAFVGNTGFGEGGVYTDLGGTLRTVADHATVVPGGTFTLGLPFWDLSLDSDQIVFTATDTATGTRALLSDVDGTLELIAGRGTPVPGEADTFYGVGPVSLDNGNILFGGAWGSARSRLFSATSMEKSASS